MNTPTAEIVTIHPTGTTMTRQPVNLSATEPARALVARNDPNEQESVVLYDPLAEV